jgi:hypothetical protein
MNWRHEYKHTLNCADYLMLRGRLRSVLGHDKHTDENGEYRVRSLYFDTPNDKALREKIDGVDRREKFRIRRYGNSTEFIRLEKKSKKSGLSHKKSAIMTADEVRLLERGDLRFMVQEDRPLVLELYSKMISEGLRPKTIVEYIREPFVFPAGNVRITLDRNIRTALYSTNFLSDSLPTIPAGESAYLLEVKYDAFLPTLIADLVDVPNRRAAAFSKYAASRIYG